MKIDLFIYAKDAKGWSTMASPSYWCDEMMGFLAPFTSLPSDNDMAHSAAAIAKACENSDEIALWRDSYVMICSEEHNFCALLRWVKISDEELSAAADGGIEMLDRGGRENWSLEGACCEYGSKEEFIMYVPSLILWIGSLTHTLFFKYMVEKSVQSKIEIPTEFLFNPFDFNQSIPSCVSEDNAAWYALCNKIYYTPCAFSFFYGPLAELFNGRLGELYEVKEIFTSSSESEEQEDLWNKTTYLVPVEVAKEKHDYRMDIRIRNKPAPSMGLKVTLQLNEISDEHGRGLTYETKEIGAADSSADIEKPEIDVSQLEFSAERVRSWAKANGWIVSDDDESDYVKRYSFTVKE